MKKEIHKANTRGHANYDWLDTFYTFSFANYYDPARVNFGTLRVLNDDWVDGGKGFGKHPHDNMEIITIALEGELEHKDSMGDTFRIKKNDVQMMSAGIGIFHSEFNHHPTEPVRLLQIWVFPDKRNLKPKYDQKTFDPKERINKWQRIVSPTEPEAVKINQDAYFSLISMDKGFSTEYKLHSENNGAYLFILEGSVNVNETILQRRDGIGIRETSDIGLMGLESSEVLLMEIPMTA